MPKYHVPGYGTDGQPLSLYLDADTREEARHKAAQVEIDGVRFQTIEDEAIEALPAA
jgi:hypothetical protein